jgi:hypothetical protein
MATSHRYCPSHYAHLLTVEEQVQFCTTEWIARQQATNYAQAVDMFRRLAFEHYSVATLGRLAYLIVHGPVEHRALLTDIHQRYLEWRASSDGESSDSDSSGDYEWSSSSDCDSDDDDDDSQFHLRYSIGDLSDDSDQEPVDQVDQVVQAEPTHVERKQSLPTQMDPKMQIKLQTAIEWVELWTKSCQQDAVDQRDRDAEHEVNAEQVDRDADKVVEHEVNAEQVDRDADKVADHEEVEQVDRNFAEQEEVEHEVDAEHEVEAEQVDRDVAEHEEVEQEADHEVEAEQVNRDAERVDQLADEQVEHVDQLDAVCECLSVVDDNAVDQVYE